MSLTITANLFDLTGTGEAAWATFDLVGFGASPPRVSGAMLSETHLKAVASGGGAISQVIYGADVITPTGTTYVVTIFDSGGAMISQARYKLTGSGSVDLSTLTPL